MRVDYIEVAGFRGFRERARFNFPRGFGILTGRNGAGKSSVLDAFDYAMTGTINKYEIIGAKGGGLREHIWWVGDEPADENYVELGLRDSDDKRLTIRRSLEGGLETSKEEMFKAFCSQPFFDKEWPTRLVETTLIRDEAISRLSLDLSGPARFDAVRGGLGTATGTDYSDRLSSIKTAARENDKSQQLKLEKVQDELSRALNALTEAKSVASQEADTSKARELLESLAPDLTSGPENQMTQLRSMLADRKRAVNLLSDAITQAERLLDQLSHLDSDTGLEELEEAKTELSEAIDARIACKNSLQDAEDRLERAKEDDRMAAQALSLLELGETIGLQSGHCPLCDVERTNEQFSTAIREARQQLSQRTGRLEEAQERVEKLSERMLQCEINLGEALDRVDEMLERRDSIYASLDELESVFEEHDFNAHVDRPDEARAALSEYQDSVVRIEQALYLLEASSAHDRVATLEERVSNLRMRQEEEASKAASAERSVEVATQISNVAQTVTNEFLAEQFDTVLPLLKELYRRLRPHADWREIEIDFGGRIRASLNFLVGDGRNPQFLFSSGQRRAAGLSFLLAIHLSRPWCRLNTLLLDDPIQHIDDYRSINVVEVLSAIRRTGRQVIVAVEDHNLAHLLSRRLRSSTDEGGALIGLAVSENGSCARDSELDVSPLLANVLKAG